MKSMVVINFLKDRKDEWLKKKIKNSMSEEEKEKILEEANSKFSLQEWLPDASKRAGQISISTHPCRFSHPSSRKNKNGTTTSIIYNGEFTKDGLLRSGNVKDLESDALGNAAVLDVYKFLNLELEDGKKLIEHIKEESDIAKDLLSIDTASYEELRDGFLAMIESKDSQIITSSKIKQVYFPIANGEYHLLSLITNSAIVFKLRKIIDDLKFSKESTAFRDARRDGKCIEEKEYKELYDLVMIGYGGSNHQNISVLNTKYGGKAYLLPSMPPNIKERLVKFPKRDFFRDSLPTKEINKIFKSLQRISEIDYNNVNIRNARIFRYRDLMDIVLEYMSAVRSVSNEQYHTDSNFLPKYQLIWLLESRDTDRLADDIWLDKLIDVIVRWIVTELERETHHKLKLGSQEYQDIKDVVSEYKEVLR